MTASQGRVPTLALLASSCTVMASGVPIAIPRVEPASRPAAVHRATRARPSPSTTATRASACALTARMPTAAHAARRATPRAPLAWAAQPQIASRATARRPINTAARASPHARLAPTRAATPSAPRATGRAPSAMAPLRAVVPRAPLLRPSSSAARASARARPRTTPSFTSRTACLAGTLSNSAPAVRSRRWQRCGCWRRCECWQRCVHLLSLPRRGANNTNQVGSLEHRATRRPRVEHTAD